MVIVLALTLLDSMAPPRNGDAMRYHLAQPKEMLRSGVLRFLPYFHYNFPRTFHLAFLIGEWTRWPALSAMLCWVTMLAACEAVIRTALLSLAELDLALPKARTRILVLACFFLTPGIIQSSSVPNSDVAVMCFFAWGVYFSVRATAGTGKEFCNWALSGLCFGLAIGSKYHGLLLVGIFETALAGHYWPEIRRRGLLLPLGTKIGVMVAVGSPFYVLNLANTGNPLWPLFSEHLGRGGLLDEVASGYRLPPSFGAHLILDHISRPFCLNPLVICMALLAVPLLIREQKLIRLVGLTAAVYVASVLLLTSYHRFQLLAWPLLSLLSVVAYATYRGCRWKRSLMHASMALGLISGVSFGAWYSMDFVKWATGIYDSEDIREMSFYYQDYRWMNNHLDRDSDMVLVIVRSGHTYYLDIPYVRADPRLAATVNWADVANTGARVLEDFVRQSGVTHVFADLQTDARVDEALRELAETGSLEVVWRQDSRRLITQRMTRRSVLTEVALYRVAENALDRQLTRPFVRSMGWAQASANRQQGIPPPATTFRVGGCSARLSGARRSPSPFPSWTEKRPAPHRYQSCAGGLVRG